MTFMKIYIESGEEKAELEQIESIPFVIKKNLIVIKREGLLAFRTRKENVEEAFWCSFFFTFYAPEFGSNLPTTKLSVCKAK